MAIATFLNTAGSWMPGSDRARKHAIQEIDYGLAEVLLLHPVRYKLIGTDQDDIGFIAQEVKKSFLKSFMAKRGK